MLLRGGGAAIAGSFSPRCLPGSGVSFWLKEGKLEIGLRPFGAHLLMNCWQRKGQCDESEIEPNYQREIGALLDPAWSSEEPLGCSNNTYISINNHIKGPLKMAAS